MMFLQSFDLLDTDNLLSDGEDAEMTTPASGSDSERPDKSAGNELTNRHEQPRDRSRSRSRSNQQQPRRSERLSSHNHDSRNHEALVQLEALGASHFINPVSKTLYVKVGYADLTKSNIFLDRVAQEDEHEELSDRNENLKAHDQSLFNTNSTEAPEDLACSPALIMS